MQRVTASALTSILKALEEWLLMSRSASVRPSILLTKGRATRMVGLQGWRGLTQCTCTATAQTVWSSWVLERNQPMRVQWMGWLEVIRWVSLISWLQTWARPTDPATLPWLLMLVLQLLTEHSTVGTMVVYPEQLSSCLRVTRRNRLMVLGLIWQWTHSMILLLSFKRDSSSWIDWLWTTGSNLVSPSIQLGLTILLLLA